jgi:hypothetical protein
MGLSVLCVLCMHPCGVVGPLPGLQCRRQVAHHACSGVQLSCLDMDT